MLHEVAKADLGSLGLAWALVLSGLFVGAYRWRTLTLAYGGEDIPPVPTLVRYLLVGAYFNMLPGGIAGEGIRALRMRPHMGDVVASLSVLVVERIVGLLALLALAALAMAWHPRGDHAVLVRYFTAGVTLAFLLATGAMLLPYLIGRGPRWRRAIARVPVIGTWLLKVPPARRPILIGGCILLSLLTQGLAMGSIFTISRGIASDAPTAILGALPLVVLATHVPIVPGGLGQREAAFVYFYGLVGVDSTLALGTSVILSLFVVSLSALGGALYVLDTAFSGRLNRSRR